MGVGFVIKVGYKRKREGVIDEQSGESKRKK